VWVREASYLFTRHVTGSPEYESHRRTSRKTLFSITENHHVVTFFIVSVSQMNTSHHFTRDSVELGYFYIINMWMKDWQANKIILPDIPQGISSQDNNGKRNSFISCFRDFKLWCFHHLHIEVGISRTDDNKSYPVSSVATTALPWIYAVENWVS
jgi:hypothetical protein